MSIILGNIRLDVLILQIKKVKFVPLKLLKRNTADKVDVKSDPSKGYKSINISSDDGLIISPTTLNSGNKTEITLDNTTVDPKDLGTKVFGCENMDLLVVNSIPKSYTVKTFLLCETDDDQNRDPNIPITSPDDICVYPGADGSLDEHLNLPIGNGTRWVSSQDKVKLINGVKHIVAGTDLTCQTTARTNNERYSTLYSNWNSVLQSVNDMYIPSETSFVFENATIYKINYDAYVDDGKMDAVNEAENFRLIKYGSENGHPNELEMFITDKGVITQKSHSPGAFAYVGEDIVFLSDETPSNLRDVVMAHEIGHAKFKLRHPV